MYLIRKIARDIEVSLFNRELLLSYYLKDILLLLKLSELCKDLDETESLLKILKL